MYGDGLAIKQRGKKGVSNSNFGIRAWLGRGGKGA